MVQKERERGEPSNAGGRLISKWNPLRTKTCKWEREESEMELWQFFLSFGNQFSLCS